MRDFNSFIHSQGLWDSPLLNASFTWTNSQDSPTMSRLDRFLISNCWEDLYSHFIQEALPKIVSDHWLILLYCSKEFGVAPFRFENMSILHPSFVDCVGKWWSECEVLG